MSTALAIVTKEWLGTLWISCWVMLALGWSPEAAEDLIAQPARVRWLGLLSLTAGLGGRVVDLVYAGERGFLAASQRSCMS